MKHIIIYEDNEIILIHKPAGIPVQTGRIGQKDIVSMLKNYRMQKGEAPYIVVVHRLDQPVEGLLLTAKTKEAAAGLGSQWNAHTAEKYYRAIVYNRVASPLAAGDEGILTDYLQKDGRTNCSKVVKSGTKDAKKAVLHYKVLKSNERFADLWIRLETGRHHQIRVQLANASLPIAGDHKYGGNLLQGYSCAIRQEGEKDAEGIQLALCAVKIGFMHPKTGQKMEFGINPQNPAFQLLCESDIA